MTKTRETMIAELGRRHPAAADDVDAILAMPCSDADNEQAVMALKPFADACEMFAWPVYEPDNYQINPGTKLTVGDLRAAREAIRALSRKAKP